MSDPNRKPPPNNPLGVPIPGHQAKSKQPPNVIKNQAEVSSFDDSQSERMQVDSHPSQPNTLTFRVPGQS